MSRITAVILAAGQGKRMNSRVAKQFLSLQDKPLLYYSLKAFEESFVDDIILVTGSGQVEYCQKHIVEKFHYQKVIKVIEGGKERYDSVYKALLNIEATDYVLIHDGARPFITKKLIQKVIEHVKEDKACIIGTPVKETIKVVNAEGIITATPNRSILWSAQTPQAFEYIAIKKAYDMFYEDDRSSLEITDDAMVYEKYLNRPVKMLLGDYNNIKITTSEDFNLAEEILKRVLFE